MSKFTHAALNAIDDKSIVYTAMSKHLFYYRMHISKYVIEQEKVPLNPFMLFDYSLSDMVDKNLILLCNNKKEKKADELWVFGNISNGVFAEIKLAQKINIPIKFFEIQRPHKIVAASKEMVTMESDVEIFKAEL